MYAGLLPAARLRRLAPPAGLAAGPTTRDGRQRPRRCTSSTPPTIAAVIVEPVLQGAGGMHVYDPGSASATSPTLARAHDALVIFDEIATGFWRTGTSWAGRPLRRRAGHPVRRQGADRRLPDPGRRAHAPPRSPPRRRLARRRDDARPHLHGQPARLRRRDRPASTCSTSYDNEAQHRRDRVGAAARARARARARRRGRRPRPRRRRVVELTRPVDVPARHRRRPRRRRVGAAVPQPRLHDAAVRQHRPTTWRPSRRPSSAPSRRCTDEQRSTSGSPSRPPSARRCRADPSLRDSDRGGAAARPRRQRLPRPVPRPARRRRRAMRAAETSGAGAGASRLVTGTLSLHTELERRPRRVHRLPDARWCSPPATTRTSRWSPRWPTPTPSSSATRTSTPRSSTPAGCPAAQVRVVPHNDVDAVEQALADRTQPRALVLVESIYSVLGDAAPLAELAGCVRASTTRCWSSTRPTGSGSSAPGGRGPARRAGLAGSTHVVVTGTLSKSLGAQGGFVLGSPAVREHLVNRARPFIYDTGLAPAAAGAALGRARRARGRPDAARAGAARERRRARRCLWRHAARRRGALGPDAGTAGGGRRRVSGRRSRRPDRLLPPAVDARRQSPGFG